MRMMNEIPILVQEPKGGVETFLQDAELNAPNLNRFKPGHFIDIGPRSEETAILKSTPTTHWESGTKSHTE